MKLLIEADDFGFTEGVAYGVIEAIKSGACRNTGLFVNMPAAQLAADLIKQYPDICLGIDFNIVSGPCTANPELIPHLVDDSGCFVRSSIRVQDERWNTVQGRNEMFPYHEVRIELKAQLDRFKLLTGKMPEYLHEHSISSENYRKVIKELSEEYRIPYSMDIIERYQMVSNFDEVFFEEFTGQDLIDQISKDNIKIIENHENYLLKNEYAILILHPGFVDAELMRLTSLSFERVKDLEFLKSDWLNRWITNNQIELITYRDVEISMSRKG